MRQGLGLGSDRVASGRGGDCSPGGGKSVGGPLRVEAGFWAAGILCSSVGHISTDDTLARCLSMHGHISLSLEVSHLAEEGNASVRGFCFQHFAEVL